MEGCPSSGAVGVRAGGDLMGEHAAHVGQVASRAAMVARWVGANPGMLHGWAFEQGPDGWVLVASVRVPVTDEELERYYSI